MMDESARLRRAYQEAVRVAILEEWDPIGINQFSEAADEYDAYVSELVNLLIAQKSENEIFEYLWKLETSHMGLEGDKPATYRFVHRLIQIQHEIELVYRKAPNTR